MKRNTWESKAKQGVLRRKRSIHTFFFSFVKLYYLGISIWSFGSAKQASQAKGIINKVSVYD